jgi:hypothetical protein
VSRAGRGLLTLRNPHLDPGLAACWAGMFFFDSLVFCMTLYKSVILPRPNGVNILDILFRDGELYLFTH